MEREFYLPVNRSHQPLIDTDLPPLYQLTEPQYQSIINRMTNLLGEVAQRFAQSGNTELARIATEQGYEILRDYDDDVAEAVRWCVPRIESQTKLSVREADQLPPRIEE